MSDVIVYNPEIDYECCVIVQTICENLDCLCVICVWSVVLSSLGLAQ